MNRELIREAIDKEHNAWRKRIMEWADKNNVSDLGKLDLSSMVTDIIITAMDRATLVWNPEPSDEFTIGLVNRYKDTIQELCQNCKGWSVEVASRLGEYNEKGFCCPECERVI